MSDEPKYLVAEMYGHRFMRPRNLVFVETIYVEPTLLDRVLGAISGAWWGFLTLISPTLPILGALVGYAVAQWLLP